MRSLTDLALAALFLIAVAAAASAQPSNTAQRSDTAPRGGPTGAPEAPSAADIARAVERVKADPSLATERTITTLRWKTGGEPTQSAPPAWRIGLIRWIGSSTRLIVWAVVFALAAGLIVFLVRVLQERQGDANVDTFVAPTHVRDLDIRPETLPPDIGAAARARWDGGDHRAALALLYRGLLSRLAHVHRVPIRDSSTEGDCLALADGRLRPDRWEYAVRMIGVWQRAVYGHEDVAAAAVYTLCDGFAAALDQAPGAEAHGATT